eukprot:647696-Karenia_brevis.AAC.1
MDAWSPADFKLFSDLAFAWAATLLNLIENGNPWPSDLLHTRAPLLCKNPKTPYDPLAWRVLWILPNLYRRWASARLAQLGDWVELWSLDTMHAGIPGSGADDAWYHTSLSLEVNHMKSINSIGGSIDIYKCFDQIVR